jgi:hypothetical protein
VDTQALDLRPAHQPALHPQENTSSAATSTTSSARYNPKNRHGRKKSDRLKDESLEDSANLPDPDVLAREIVEDLEAALPNSPKSAPT